MTPALQQELTDRRSEILAILTPSVPSLESAPRPTALPLSFAQQRLWFLHQLDPDSAAYVIANWFVLPGVRDVEVLRRSLDEVVRRHEALRTTFENRDGVPVQVIGPATPVALGFADLAGLSTEEQKAAATRLHQDEAARPFDLERGPLFRAHVVRLGPDQYALLVAVHHIVFDGLSNDILIREVTTLYEAYANGQSSPLPELPLQYADYAVWQRQWLQGERLDVQLAYWRELLRAPLPVLDLPTDRPRPSLQTTRGSLETLRLTPELVAGLRRLGQQTASTAFMTLLSGFALVLGRLAGQDDVVVGFPIAGRTRPEAEPLIGLFVNTLVLRADLSGDPSVRELLGRVSQRALEAYAHQDVPFERLVEELKPERDLSRSPVFQVMFNLTQVPEDVELPGRIGPAWDLETPAPRLETKFDLTLNAWQNSSGIGLILEYNADLFDRTTARRMLEHLRVVLDAMVADPAQPITTLSLLTAAEREHMLVGWNRTESPYPADACVHQLIEAQVARTPNSVAAELEGAGLTYRELDARANQLGRVLLGRGAGPGVLVGICLERSIEMLVALLAVLKTGAAYVPLDPTYPDNRLAFMLADSGAGVLITQESLATRVPPSTARVLRVDADAAEIAGASAEPIRALVTPEDVAYVIYTSGSTGQPKGVAVLHQGVVNFLCSMQRQPGLTASDVLLAVTTLSFDIAGLELFLPLVVGARVVICPRHAATDGVALARAIDTAGITVMQATPATWQMLMDAGWSGRDGLKVLCGGDTLPRALADMLLERVGEVWNLYGPTETTIWSTAHRVGPDTSAVSIGRPIANTRIYIVDRHGQPTPIGVAGELCIGGDGVARGYLNRPELTTERFVPDPFAGVAGARMYRTGDLARYRANGGIEFLGRLDHQVKVRGHRIELGEIEAALAEHPDVRQAVAVVRQDPPGDRRLVAYVVCERADAGLVDELRAELRRRLPEYMVPSAFAVVAALPLTSNGKVDRLRLPAPEPRRPAAATAAPPETPLEQSIVEVWRELLGRPDVGVDDNFFDLGGHSLLAVRMLDAVEKICGQRLPVSTLFAGATIRHLIRVMRERPAGEGVKLLTPLQAGGSRTPFFFLYGDWAGGGFYCRELTRQVGPEQPFYVFHPWGLDGGTVPPTIEQMAEAYLRELRAVRPIGPYLLGGYCLGGLVALEMAQRLRAQGEQVAFLMAIDTLAWNVSLRGLRRLSGRLAGLIGLTPASEQRMFLKAEGALVAFARLVYLCSHPRATLRKVFQRVRGERSTPVQPSVLDLLYRRAAWSYVPERYGGSITLFVVDEFAGELFERNWRKVADEIEVYRMPGDHLGVVKHHVDVIGKQLGACLDAVRDRMETA
jgi:aspartate racemase